MCKMDEEIVMPGFAALRATVFPLSTKNIRGHIRPPSVRGIIDGSTSAVFVTSGSTLAASG